MWEMPGRALVLGPEKSPNPRLALMLSLVNRR